MLYDSVALKNIQVLSIKSQLNSFTDKMILMLSNI